MQTQMYTEPMSWADMQEEDDKQAAGGSGAERGGPSLVMLPLPTREVSPDGSVVTTVEYRLNGEGKKVKTTRRLKIVRKKTRKYHSAEERRTSFKKFGACTNPNNDKGVTFVSGDEIVVEIPHAEGEEKEEEKQPTAGGGISITCRNCGGDHYTKDCKESARAPSSMPPPPSDDGPSSGLGGSGGAYRPPALRNGGKMTGGGFASTASGEDLDLPVVRVDNLSETAVEDDLKELFRRYGLVHRVRILKKFVKDLETGEDIRISRGIAFVIMKRIEDAQKAINGLDRHGYDNLILSVTMAETERERIAKKEKNDSQTYRRRQ